MPSLADLQRGLAAHILAGDAASSGAPELLGWLELPSGVDPASRLAAYADGYPARIAVSLAEAFPALAKITGNTTFAALAHRYAAQLDGEQKNLNYIGEGLCDFARDDSLGERLPFLADLAEFEWAVVRCFHTEVQRPFDLSACAQWTLEDWARARIHFQPGARIVRSEWPLRELRAARDSERSEIDIDLVDRPDRVLVYRSGYDVVTDGIDAVEYDAIAQLRAGESLGELMNRLAADDSDRAGTLLARWASLGLIVDCELSTRNAD
jgi:hypothetical protein